MKKLLNSLTLLVAVGALSTLAGCELYFGNSGGNGDDSTVGGSGGGGGSGYECTTNTDCSSGCYCAPNHTCTEGGFCTSDSDCGSGYSCDTSRSSCEPIPPPPPVPTCSADTDCDQSTGQYCDLTTNTCAQASCAGDVTCTTAMPVCPSGQIALSANGCWTGGCVALDACDTTASCSRINDESDCLARTSDCSALYTGLNCSKMDGTACHAGDTGCVCADFEFASCTDKTASTGRMVQDSSGRMLDASQLMLH